MRTCRTICHPRPRSVDRPGPAGTKNGTLLKRASGECDVFVTMGGNIEYQRDFANLPFGVVVFGAASNRMADLQPVVPV